MTRLSVKQPLGSPGLLNIPEPTLFGRNTCPSNNMFNGLLVLKRLFSLCKWQYISLVWALYADLASSQPHTTHHTLRLCRAMLENLHWTGSKHGKKSGTWMHRESHTSSTRRGKFSKSNTIWMRKMYFKFVKLFK